jgi:hypothetical protein
MLEGSILKGLKSTEIHGNRTSTIVKIDGLILICHEERAYVELVTFQSWINLIFSQ